MEMVQKVSCQHLRTAEDNTYLQVDMQANICRSRTDHFVHMQVWNIVKVMAFTCTTATRTLWIDAMGYQSLTYLRRHNAFKVIVSTQVKGCTMTSDENWLNCVRRDISWVGRVPLGRL